MLKKNLLSFTAMQYYDVNITVAEAYRNHSLALIVLLPERVVNIRCATATLFTFKYKIEANRK